MNTGESDTTCIAGNEHSLIAGVSSGSAVDRAIDAAVCGVFQDSIDGFRGIDGSIGTHMDG